MKTASLTAPTAPEARGPRLAPYVNIVHQELGVAQALPTRICQRTTCGDEGVGRIVDPAASAWRSRREALPCRSPL